MAKPKSKPLIMKQRDSQSSPLKGAGGMAKKKGKKKKETKISHGTNGKDSITGNGQNSSLINGTSLKVPASVTTGQKVDGSTSKIKVEGIQGHRLKKVFFKHKKGDEFKSDSNNLNVTKVPHSGDVRKNTTTNAVSNAHIDVNHNVNVGVKTTSQLSTVESTSSNSQTTTSTTSLEASGGKHHKKSKASKKKQSGSSNWMKLCSTLNISTERKAKPVKRQMEQTAKKAEAPEPKRSKPEIWFDNVDKILLETSGDEKETDRAVGSPSNNNQDSSHALVKPDSFKGVTNCVAMDCEMVGIGRTAEESMLARVSIVNHFGVCLYDKFVKPQEKVTDYRTFVSGVTEENLAEGEDFTKVQKEVSDILKGRILVGHAVHNDLKVLFLTHPHKMIRDTSVYQPFRALFNGRKPALKKLTDKVLGVKVQEGQHSSVQDAQATMRLYTMYRQRWEKELKGKRKKKEKDTKKKE